MHDAGTSNCVCVCAFHCNFQCTVAPLCPRLDMMIEVSEAVASTSGHPAWAIAMLSMLLKLYKVRSEHYQPESSQLFMASRVENVRECTRNLMTFLGPRLEWMPILWSVCTAFRILICAEAAEAPEVPLDEDNVELLTATLNGCPASGACASSEKESFHVLAEECRFLGVLKDEVNNAIMALRAWRSAAYEHCVPEVESKLEDLVLFYQDVGDYIRFVWQTRTARPGDDEPTTS